MSKLSQYTTEALKAEMKVVRDMVDKEYGWLHKNKRYKALQNEYSNRVMGKGYFK